MENVDCSRLVAGPQGLNHFYSSQAGGRVVMYGGHILAFIVVFEWIHREIGILDKGIQSSEKIKNASSASEVLVFDLTRPD